MNEKDPSSILERIEQWDHRIFLKIYHGEFSTRIRSLAKIYSFFGNALWWAVVGVFIFFLNYFMKDYYLFFLFFGGYCQSIILFLILRYGFINRRRPYRTLKEHGVEKSDEIVRESRSFPSGHVTFFIFYGCLFSFYFESYFLLIIFVGLAILMALSRLILGMHFPSDVIVGLISGSIFALLYLGLTYPLWIELFYFLVNLFPFIFY